jgi:hypothetical protein
MKASARVHVLFRAASAARSRDCFRRRYQGRARDAFRNHGRCAGRPGMIPCALRQRSARRRTRSHLSASLIRNPLMCRLFLSFHLAHLGSCSRYFRPLATVIALAIRRNARTTKVAAMVITAQTKAIETMKGDNHAESKRERECGTLNPFALRNMALCRASRI